MIKTRWQDLMENFGFNDNKSEFEELTKRYQENHRAYHNLNHVEDCLDQLDNYKDEIDDKAIIELAIWYHDIIYNPYGKNNELKSAEVSSAFLINQGASDDIINKVYDLIISTLHVDKPKNKLEALIMDIDITILGSPEIEYAEYYAKIRKEYKWIPGIIYRKKRKEIMQRFLQRDRLYFTDSFYTKLEERARFNISKEIKSLN